MVLTGMTLAYCGRWKEGDLAARHVLRRSPRDPFSAVYCAVVAYAQFVGRNYDEAIRLSRQGVRLRSDFVGAPRVLTAAAAMAGQDDLAKFALHELYRVQPNISPCLDLRAFCRSNRTLTVSTIRSLPQRGFGLIPHHI